MEIQNHPSNLVADPDSGILVVKIEGTIHFQKGIETRLRNL